MTQKEPLYSFDIYKDERDLYSVKIRINTGIPRKENNFNINLENMFDSLNFIRKTIDEDILPIYDLNPLRLDGTVQLNLPLDS